MLVSFISGSERIGVELQCSVCQKTRADLFPSLCKHTYCKECTSERITDIQHVVEIIPEDQRVLLCDFCTGRKLRAVGLCRTCPASTLPGLKNHVLEDFERSSCPQHHLGLELFCTTDQKPICRVCAEMEHKGHDISYSTVSFPSNSSCFYNF